MDKRSRQNVKPLALVKPIALLMLLTLSQSDSIRSQPINASPARPTLSRTVDLNLGESVEVVLSDGKPATVKLVDLQETRDSVRDAVRLAEVTIEVNGQRKQIASANYRLPTNVGGVLVDCPITKGYYSNAHQDAWGLVKDARLRLWPAKSPLIEPGEFIYPVKQRWFATATQMANEPTYVDGVERPSVKKIYYHSGEDIGGAEGMVEVVAATDGLIVSSGLNVLEGHRRTGESDSPVAERYDVVYLLDARGWYYRYSHLREIDPQIVPGRAIRKGDRLGTLGKEGASGGWSHLHFEIKSRQPSGKWGTEASYGMLWEAHLRQQQPSLVAVARPHHLLWAGEKAVLDGSRSWSKTGAIARYEWTFTDGSTATGPQVQRTYAKPGEYSEILKATDAAGNIDYDFAIVQVLDRARPDDVPQGIHATYAPSLDLKPGDPITFQVRSFGPFVGHERWDFGDGSSTVDVQSDGNAKALAKDGYAKTVHRYEKPGLYLVSVTSKNVRGETATGRLEVHVGGDMPAARVERSLVVGGQGYFPVALRLKDGRIAVVLRGGAGHLGLAGRLDMVFSADEGRTWSQPTVVVDSPLDDRNPALGQAADGTLVVSFWRTATYDDKGRYDPNLDKERSTWVTRSADGGQTWSPPTAIDCADIGLGSPFGRMLTLPDGSMQMALYGEAIRPAGEKLKRQDHSYLYRSTDNGQTWTRYAELGAGHGQFNETALVQLSGGKLLAAMRSRAGEVWLTTSNDSGQNWSALERLSPASVHPADLSVLPDGRVLLVMGDRRKPFGVLAIVGDRDGRFDWNNRFSLMNDAVSADCGYPSSVVLHDGRLLTTYYATRVTEHPEWGVHCGALLYQPTASAK
jgi:murein DD-endopeptidase MepM/ murein hydrolase activator NlpD